MSYNFKPVNYEDFAPLTLKKPNEYSTDEIVVGKWIDGKRIYRKVFNYTETTSTGNDLVIATLTNLNIDKIIKFDGVVNRGNNVIVNIISYENPTYFHSVKYNSTSKELIVNYSNYYGDVYCALEYTKTTDEV